MSYQEEVPKEFLRNMYMDGYLDITGNYENIASFVTIFAGEMEAIIAINCATFLSLKEQKQLRKLAKPTTETIRHYNAWLAKVHNIV